MIKTKWGLKTKGGTFWTKSGTRERRVMKNVTTSVYCVKCTTIFNKTDLEAQTADMERD